MPQEVMRGLKGLVVSSTSNGDYELAQRKAEETAVRRYQAVAWLRQMDQGATETLPEKPSENEFSVALRNGLILCNVLNKVNPGSDLKVVENPITPAIQYAEGAAQSAIQYFENMRNFLKAVEDMQLLTFGASDLEKGGSSNKVVDCILCLKGFYEWKQAGGVGVWRYGGTVRIVSFNPKGSSPRQQYGVGSESTTTDESVSLDESESSSQYDQLLDFLHLSNEISTEESETAISLSFLFDHFALQLLQAYIKESDGSNDLPLNEMVIDSLLNKVVKDFSAILVSQGTQLGSFLKKILKCDNGDLSRSGFVEAVFRYLQHRKDLVKKEFSKFCKCGGKLEFIRPDVREFSPGHADAIGVQQKELEEVKSNFVETRCQVEQMQSEWQEELQRIVHHVKSMEVTSSSYHKVLEENRLLYNEVQDLKGTIRVYCRVRPFLQEQKDMQSTVDYIGENGNIIINNPFKQEKDARKIFAFNKVFGQNVSQEQIYIDTQPVIRSVLDGFNVCIFAYGQTGSGKTYTMSGPDLMTETTWGVNYRALRDLFQLSNARTHVVTYEIGVQMIEIYNEQVRDLLVSDGSSRRLDIRNNSQLNGLNVPDASLIPVSNTRDVLDLMRIGQKNRAVGATALNERSSRSHSVLTVHVQGKELASGSILRGCLHLVDLAGSERVEKSEAVGERLKEAQHINKSLSALGDVIYALAQKSSHIPYRNSKLTQVLQDSLGGQAKTLMFVHINPEVNAVGETISTLKFAQRVASIELGAARSNKETGEIRDLKDEISSLKSAMEKKEAELEQLRSGSIRNATECQRARAVSPFHLPRNGNGAGTKAEASPQPNDSTRSYETRSCSTGKQRKTGFPSALRNREASPRMPNVAEERLNPSPNRRSLSTDRGSAIKSRNKSEVTQNLPVARTPFPARVPVAKSFATVPLNPSAEITSETFHNHQKLSARKLFPEIEEEHIRHTLHIRQGGVKKTRAESSKAKAKQPSPGRFQKLDVGISLRSEADSEAKVGNYQTQKGNNNHNVIHSRFQNFDVGISLFSDLCAGDKSDSTLKSDSSETDNEPPLKSKNSQRNVSKSSLNNKLRAIYAHEDTSLVNEKPLNGTAHIKEGNSPNISMPEFRRSRSTHHARFMVP
ncbi:PREDICTED: kinesin-like protein KIN-14F [Camelina sativa]|uniref:Kinesin-like protein KIN-14F n=1 Tax=Camelina sativa TaxID=90675 RepID=A0ABM0ZEX7_CAMSA|nr:PREDICTED: kinesin-like protein KIN-14F [Camelina sativa]XP_010514798.1 PREDICTED: kinesin-like protein KIN-14F [Camelina sativa]